LVIKLVVVVATVTVGNVWKKEKGQALPGGETATQLIVLCLSKEVGVIVLKQEHTFDKYK